MVIHVCPKSFEQSMMETQNTESTQT